MMERWCGIVKVPVQPNSNSYYKVAASLCLSPISKTLTVPSANAIFFNGDNVEGTGSPVIEKLSDLRKLAEIVVSKFGSSINAWVIEAASFNGPFAIYSDFIPSVNQWGEPKLYSSVGFPASTSTVSLLSNCLKEVKNAITSRQVEPYQATSSYSHLPNTYILGFSKGGTVLNQLVTELSFIETTSLGINQPTGNNPSKISEEMELLPRTKESFLNSITEIHYVDVGLNSSGAYLTDPDVIARITRYLTKRGKGIRFVFHGTPRQWCDGIRNWIRNEKDRMVQLLGSEAERSGEKLQVRERFYFANQPPDLQMHFEIIEAMDVH